MVKKITALAIYSFGHALVDAASIAAVMGLSYQSDGNSRALWFVLLYNFVAFATQPLLGFLADKFMRPERAAACGCLLTAFGLMFFPLPYCSIVLVGIGNALFHVGGGIISLHIDPGKAWALGVFIAPGNLGVLIGTLAAKRGFNPWLYIILLVLAAFICILTKQPDSKYIAVSPTTQSKSGRMVFYAALSLIMVTIAVRSFAGLAVEFPWKKDLTLLVMLSVCVTLGKAIGGFMADRFGYIKVPAIGLLLSIPCIIFGLSEPVAGSIGMLLFNLTMPVTLLLASNLVPESKGFAFGLTVLALSMGSIPAYSGLKLTEIYGIAASISISVITLIWGYSMYQKTINRKQEVLHL